jgi:hypothetical protein
MIYFVAVFFIILWRMDPTTSTFLFRGTASLIAAYIPNAAVTVVFLIGIIYLVLLIRDLQSW